MSLTYDTLGRLWQVQSSAGRSELAYDGAAGSPVRETHRDVIARQRQRIR